MKIRQMLLEMDGAIGADSGVENVSAAETQTESGENTSAADSQPNNFEKAFAKRLSAKEAEWNKQREELEGKYKDYDRHAKASSYLLKSAGFSSMDELNEAIEMDELRERADKEGITPAMQKRLDELESKANKFDEWQKEQEQQKTVSEFEGKIKAFAQEKGVDHMELWQFMHDQKIGTMEAAFKAFKYEEAAAEREKIEKEAIEKYLASKKGPKAEGAGAPGATSFKPSGNMQTAEQRAIARIRAANQQM